MSSYVVFDKGRGVPRPSENRSLEGSGKPDPGMSSKRPNDWLGVRAIFHGLMRVDVLSHIPVETALLLLPVASQKIAALCIPALLVIHIFEPTIQSMGCKQYGCHNHDKNIVAR